MNIQKSWVNQGYLCSYALSRTIPFYKFVLSRKNQKQVLLLKEAVSPLLTDSGIRPAQQAGEQGSPIAFFDVDGTIAKTNIVWPFVHIQLTYLSIFQKIWWVPLFALMSFVYRAVDKFDRTAFNRLFYKNYKGYTQQQQSALARIAMEKYYQRRIFSGAVNHIQDLQKQGYWIVLVTGQLDFIAQELASAVGANDVIASSLEVDDNGTFTGELHGQPVSDGQKQVLMKQYALEHGTDLSACIAYGDSISDLPMLTTVGTAITVAPDGKLRELAVKNQWKIIDDWQ
eukprot:TRINITY_DN2309_c1_g3_i2.p4 TRINITY_DN2309_c1_g3~~TRINITY_DN2309_c1_g3_i2.p4  ORF type:complete len:304 (+),score=26.92 TRINITY_DN2309_c1_g3_i2:58-912(+)